MRARGLKPGFFHNEDLIEMAFEYRLLFAGLWCLADREGRLEDRPKKIKLNVFPGDNVDVDAGLQALHDRGFIQRYTHGNTRYIQILAWKKHQHPHVKEGASTIPAPCEHSASPVQAPDKHQTSTSVARLTPSSLTPDSGLLTPHSPSEREARAQEPEVRPRVIDGGTRLTGITPTSTLEAWRRDVPECNPEAFARWIVHVEEAGRPMTPAMRLAQARRLAGNGDFPAQAEVVTYCCENGYKSLMPIADVRHRTQGRQATGPPEAPKLTWRPPPDEEPASASG